MGLTMSPWLIWCTLHPCTYTTEPQSWLWAPFVSQWQLSPNRRALVMVTWTVVSWCCAPRAIQMTYQNYFCSILSPRMGWVFPAQLLWVPHSRHLQPRANVVHLSPPCYAHNLFPSTCPSPLIPCMLTQATGLILSPWVLDKSWAQKNMLCAVIPADFPSCAPKGVHHALFPQPAPNVLFRACSQPSTGFPCPPDA